MGLRESAGAHAAVERRRDAVRLRRVRRHGSQDFRLLLHARRSGAMPARLGPGAGGGGRVARQVRRRRRAGDPRSQGLRSGGRLRSFPGGRGASPGPASGPGARTCGRRERAVAAPLSACATRHHRSLSVRRGHEPDGGRALPREPVAGSAGAGEAPVVSRPSHPGRQQPARNHAGVDRGGSSRQCVQVAAGRRSRHLYGAEEAKQAGARERSARHGVSDGGGAVGGVRHARIPQPMDRRIAGLHLGRGATEGSPVPAPGGLRGTTGTDSRWRTPGARPSCSRRRPAATPPCASPPTRCEGWRPTSTPSRLRNAGRSSVWRGSTSCSTGTLQFRRCSREVASIACWGIRRGSTPTSRRRNGSPNEIRR